MAQGARTMGENADLSSGFYVSGVHLGGIQNVASRIKVSVDDSF
jgi:hypothetical protein